MTYVYGSTSGYKLIYPSFPTFNMRDVKTNFIYILPYFLPSFMINEAGISVRIIPRPGEHIGGVMYVDRDDRGKVENYSIELTYELNEAAEVQILKREGHILKLNI